MIKINVENKDDRYLVDVEARGRTIRIIEELSKAVYSILKDLNMNESITERFDMFHGALLCEHLLNDGDDILKKIKQSIQDL